jgi:hypothetical protein
MTTADTQPRGWEEVPGLLESLWRYKWLIAVSVLLGGLLGYGWASRQPTLYEGVSRMFLAGPGAAVPGEVPAAAGEPDRYLRNQAQLIGSSEVLQRAARRGGGRVPLKTLRQRVDVDVAQDADVITIRAVDPTAEGAAELANSVRAAYEAFITEQSRRAVEQLQSTRTRLEARLTGIDAQLAGRPSDRLRRQHDAVSQELLEIERQLVATERTATSNRLEVWEDAVVPEQPIQPAPRRSVAIGMLFGLVASGALAWWLGGRRAARNQLGDGWATAGGEGSQLVRAAPKRPQRPARARPNGAVLDADVVRPLLNTLAKDPNIDCETLSDVLIRLDATLANAPLHPYLEALPRVVAREVKSAFPTDLVALLLDNGAGSFEVAGGFGLTPDEQGKVIDQNHEAFRQALWDGVHLLQGANGSHLPADIPGGRTAQELVLVPVVQGSSWLGMLLVGRHSDNGRPVTGFSDEEIGYAIRCAMNFAPIIRMLLVGYQLEQALQALRSLGKESN